MLSTFVIRAFRQSPTQCGTPSSHYISRTATSPTVTVGPEDEGEFGMTYRDSLGVTILYRVASTSSHLDFDPKQNEMY